MDKGKEEEKENANRPTKKKRIQRENAFLGLEQMFLGARRKRPRIEIPESSLDLEKTVDCLVIPPISEAKTPPSQNSPSSPGK